jgi:hypothetical protein
MIGPTDLFHPSPAPHFKTFQVFLIYMIQLMNIPRSDLFTGQYIQNAPNLVKNYKSFVSSEIQRLHGNTHED